MKYGNRSIWKKVIASPFSILAGLVLVVILAKSTWGISAKARTSAARLDQARIELAKLDLRQRELSQKVTQLSTEQGIESEIRTKYHAVKDGESVAVIVDESQTAGAGNTQLGGLTAQAGETATSSLSWWRKLLRVFGW